MKHSIQGANTKRAGHRSVIYFPIAVIILALTIQGCDLLEGPEIKCVDETEPVVEDDRLTIELSCEYNGEPIHINDDPRFELKYEVDGNDLDPYESALSVDPEPSNFEILLALDVSDSIKEPGYLRSLMDAAKDIINYIYDNRSIDDDQEISIGAYIFDGRPMALGDKRVEEEMFIVNFTSDFEEALAGIRGVELLQEEDPSTNLYGAVDWGLDYLDEMDRERRFLDDRINGKGRYKNVTALIVLTDGVHLAGTGAIGYPILGNVLNDVEHSSHQVYTIGIGKENYINEDVLKKIGKNGYMRADNLWESTGGLKDTLNTLTRYYRITYCSPRRTGRIDLTLIFNHRRGWIFSPSYEYTKPYYVPPNITPSCILEEN